ncbi:MAG: LysE family translocator [Proteobacteria bacterium]|nr:LysE family translocator [Pseudomonadota bacterium]
MTDNILALIAATAVLIVIPGPNVALIVANSLRHGYRFGFMTVLGTTCGIGLQLVCVIGGFAVLVEMAATGLTWIKWLGIAYLVYLGLRTWNEAAPDLNAIRPGTGNRAFLHGLGQAAINPKTLLFNAAFLSQFIGQSMQVTTQLVVLSAVFLITVSIGDSLWVAFAGASRKWFSKFGRLRNKLTGGFLVGAGVGLALARRSM